MKMPNLPIPLMIYEYDLQELRIETLVPNTTITWKVKFSNIYHSRSDGIRYFLQLLITNINSRKNIDIKINTCTHTHIHILV